MVAKPVTGSTIPDPSVVALPPEGVATNVTVPVGLIALAATEASGVTFTVRVIFVPAATVRDGVTRRSDVSMDVLA